MYLGYYLQPIILKIGEFLYQFSVSFTLLLLLSQTHYTSTPKRKKKFFILTPKFIFLVKLLINITLLLFIISNTLYHYTKKNIFFIFTPKFIFLVKLLTNKVWDNDIINLSF